MLIKFDLDAGTATMLQRDDFPAEEFGRLTVTRASHVEFNNDAQAWEVSTPENVKVAGGFKSRKDALEWEKVWAEDNLRK